MVPKAIGLEHERNENPFQKQSHALAKIPFSYKAQDSY